MPPKAPPKKGGPPKAPAAVLAKLKAQIEAQRKAEEEWQKQQEEEEKRRKEEERLAEIERKREEEEKKAHREEQKEQHKADKKGSKRSAQLEALERMRAAGMIIPDLPTHAGDGEKKAQKAPPKPAKKPSQPKLKEPAEEAAPAVATAAKADGEGDDVEEDLDALLAREQEAEEAKAREEQLAAEMTQAGSTADGHQPTEGVAAQVPPAATASTNGHPAGAVELRSPICCVMGHVDTGKTSLLDKIRRTNVQGGEAGGITQQIGATFFPKEALEASTAELRSKFGMQLKVPGLLVIDTPGHESFANLRSRGSSLCDIAVLVVDIMHGLEQQTKESLHLLKSKNCPFIIALNKVDRIYEWEPHANSPIQDTLAKQKKHVLQEFDTRLQKVILELAEQGFNSELYWKNKDVKHYVSIVPTSAHSGEGIQDLLVCEIQMVQRFMEGRVSFKDDLQCTVLEVKPVQGFGATIDVVLVNGVLHYADRIVLCGMNGPIVTNIRALLTPQPMKELRVKGEYVSHKEVRAAMGVKIAADNLEHAVAGTPLFVVHSDQEVAAAEKEVMKDVDNLLKNVSKSGEGVAVQSSTIGSLEALLAFFEQMKIPVSSINLGPLHKRHMLSMVAMKDKNPKYAVVLAFDVPITKEAQEIADKSHIKIFSARIIYHLFDQFTKYVEEYDNIVKERNRPIAWFPATLNIKGNIRAKDPIILHCEVTRGQLHPGTPLIAVNPIDGTTVPVGKVMGMEKDKHEVKVGKRGMDLAVKIVCQDGNLTFGRQFDEKCTLMSQVNRKSIDALKESFRSEMDEDDWKLIKTLATKQGIITGGKKKKPAAGEAKEEEKEEQEHEEAEAEPEDYQVIPGA